MLILRLENSNGFGIYSGDYAMRICHDLGDDYYAYDLRGAHPMPEQDSLLMRNGFADVPKDNIRFGFKSYTQYRAWFFNDRFLHMAEDLHNIKLVVYSVPDDKVVIGSTQCVYEKQNATKIAEFSPLDYLQDVEVGGMIIQ